MKATLPLDSLRKALLTLPLKTRSGGSSIVKLSFLAGSGLVAELYGPELYQQRKADCQCEMSFAACVNIEKLNIIVGAAKTVSLEVELAGDRLLVSDGRSIDASLQTVDLDTYPKMPEMMGKTPDGIVNMDELSDSINMTIPYLLDDYASPLSSIHILTSEADKEMVVAGSDRHRFVMSKMFCRYKDSISLLGAFPCAAISNMASPHPARFMSSENSFMVQTDTSSVICQQSSMKPADIVGAIKKLQPASAWSPCNRKALLDMARLISDMGKDNLCPVIVRMTPKEITMELTHDSQSKMKLQAECEAKSEFAVCIDVKAMHRFLSALKCDVVEIACDSPDNPIFVRSVSDVTHLLAIAVIDPKRYGLTGGSNGVQ